MPFRSILFTPANRLDRLARALAAGADWVALDLEDGVGPDDKEQARKALGDLAASDWDGQAHRIAVRISTLGSPDGIRDMAAMLDWPVWPGMVILPKVSSPVEVEQAVQLAQFCGKDPCFLVTLETAAGLVNVAAIAQAVPKTGVLGYGSADHMAETGGVMNAAGLAWARGRIVNAAALAGVPAMDGVFLDFRDADGLRDEAQLVKSMGFAGKLAIHPAQIAPINTVFSASDSEIATARAMVAASQAAGNGAFSYNGKMVDAPVLAHARRIIEQADRSMT